MPTLFMAVDLGKFPKGEIWHILYKLKKDKDCPFIALRIMTVS